MGRADIGKDIARASLCLHLNNKTLHVRPAVTPPRQRALTLPRTRPEQPLPFVSRASPLSKRCLDTGTRAFLRGTSWERRFLRAEPRYTRQSFLGRVTVFPIPQLGISSFIFSFFYFVQVSTWLKIKLRGTTFLREFLNNCELSRILLLLLSTKSARWALS